MIETRFMKIYWIYNLCPKQEEYESEVIDWKRVEFEKYQEEQLALESQVFHIYNFFCNCPPNSQAFMLEVQRDNHIEYLMKGLRNLGPSFVLLDANWPWLCCWILHSIAILGECVDVALDHNAIDFLSRCQDEHGGHGASKVCVWAWNLWSVVFPSESEKIIAPVTGKANKLEISMDTDRCRLQEGEERDRLPNDTKASGRNTVMNGLKWERCSEWVCVWFSTNYAIFAAVVWPFSNGTPLVPGWVSGYQLLARNHGDDEKQYGVFDKQFSGSSDAHH
ncbi:protein farnesyltransferase subunit beta [Tanacetum coccineum]